MANYNNNKQIPVLQIKTTALSKTLTEHQVPVKSNLHLTARRIFNDFLESVKGEYTS